MTKLLLAMAAIAVFSPVQPAKRIASPKPDLLSRPCPIAARHFYALSHFARRGGAAAQIALLSLSVFIAPERGRMRITLAFFF